MSLSILHTVSIALAERSYPIIIGAGIFDQPAMYADLPQSTSALIVSNTTVSPLYAQRLREAISNKYQSVTLVVLPDGEQYKNWETLNAIFDALLSQASDRKCILYALGGGVVGDMTGFAAACYMRGVSFVQVPTTLLAQVDSSVGGKTGINHPLGKNMIGAFHQPLQVVCDIETLKTLPERELSAGLAEVIKYGPIADLDFLDWIESNMAQLLAREPGALAHAIRRSCEIKAWIVGQDERESGLRAILNFGHTFGHAIEAGMGYGQWLHGEAVGCGMVMAAHLSLALGKVDITFVQRLTALVKAARLPVVAPHLCQKDNAGRYLELMRLDKKSEAGAIKFVVIDGSSRASICAAPDAMVRAVIDQCCG